MNTGRSARQLAWVGVVLALLLVLPQVILNVGVVERAITRGDHNVHVAWDAAWMIVPGWVVVRGLEVEELRKGTSWQLRVGSLSTRVSLRALFDRKLVLYGPSAHDLSFSFRGPVDTTDVLGLSLPSLPPPKSIAPLLRDDEAHGDAHHDAHDHATPPREAGAGPWTFRIESLRSDSVREVWIGPYRLLIDQGELELDGVFQPGRLLELHDVRFRKVNGDAWRGRDVWGGRMLDGDFALKLHAHRDESATGLDVQRGLDGVATLRFVVNDLGYLLRFANPGVLPTENLTGGAGEAFVTARIGKGRLLPGSEIRAHGDALQWRLSPGRLTGRFELDARVHEAPGGARTRVELQVEDAVLMNQQGATLGSSPRLEVSGEAQQGARLGAPPTTRALRVRLLEPAQIDLEALNPWVGGIVRFSSGQARLNLDLSWGEPVIEPSDGAQAPPGGPGRVFDLRVDRLDAHLGKTAIRGRLRARLSGAGEGPHKDGGIALGRLEVTLRDVEVGDSKAPAVKDWSGSLTLGDLLLHASPPKLQARLDGSLDSAAPVVHLLVAGGQLPRILSSLLSVPDVKLSARITATPQMARVTDLVLDGRRLSVKGRMSASERGSPEAVLLARVGIVPAGFEVKGGKVKVHLFRPYAWFESQQEAPGQGPAQP